MPMIRSRLSARQRKEENMKNEKKLPYSDAEISIIEFSCGDVITASNPGDVDPGAGDFGSENDW